LARRHLLRKDNIIDRDRFAALGFLTQLDYEAPMMCLSQRVNNQANDRFI
jgi:hypothetical protein